MKQSHSKRLRMAAVLRDTYGLFPTINISVIVEQQPFSLYNTVSVLSKQLLFPFYAVPVPQQNSRISHLIFIHFCKQVLQDPYQARCTTLSARALANEGQDSQRKGLLWSIVVNPIKQTCRLQEKVGYITAIWIEFGSTSTERSVAVSALQRDQTHCL